MNTPIKVLHVLDSFSFGGAENLIVELAAFDPPELELHVASVTVEGERDAMLGRLQAVGLRPFHLGVRRLLDPVGFARLVVRLRGMRRRGEVDIVHAHLETSLVVAGLAARLAGLPCVGTLHTLPVAQTRRALARERLAVRVAARCGFLVLVSQQAFDDFARIHGPAGPTWRMLHNGVDVARYRPQPDENADAPAQEASGPADVPDDAGPIWLAVGALRVNKAHVDLVRAWDVVRRSHPEATLWIAGEGPERPAIEAEILRLGLGDAVRLLGERDDVPLLLRRADGVVSASRSEALPTALIEACATGLPVVAMAAGGTADIVIDGETGVLVPLGNVEGLVRGLLTCLDDSEAAAAFGAQGRRLAVEEFSMPTWVQRLSVLYREAAGR